MLRSEAHRAGIWHRAVSVFVLNQFGEVLLERRSEHKDLFPGYYDIVGGHLQPGKRPEQAACREILEELQLTIPATRLEPVSSEDGVIERVVLPEQGIVNLERKTVYLLEISDDEARDLLALSARLLRLTPRELEERGATGEVSQILFWSWERLLETSRSTGFRPLASGTLSALGDDSVRTQVQRRCLRLRGKRRQEFIKAYSFLVRDPIDGPGYDRMLYDRMLEQPTAPTSVGQVEAVFDKGSDQPAGAYRLGTFREAVAGDERWEPKLRDPEGRYVRNLFTALGMGQSHRVQQQLDQLCPRAQAFVGDLLNFPLTNGGRFRDSLANLSDIAAARKAAVLWLESEATELVQREMLDYPSGVVTKACLEAGRRVLARNLRSTPRSGLSRFRELTSLGLGCASADFNNPAFQALLRAHSTAVAQVTQYLEQATGSSFCPALGGDQFLREFYSEYVESGRRVTITYLAGNAAQASVSLAIAQEILLLNGEAKIRFVTKSGTPGSDLALTDAISLLESGSTSVFADLARFREDGRFTLEEGGPESHGLDPGRLSANLARALAAADVILAEGQGYAEIRGWKKPAYIAFRVNGRVAEAIHGISRESGAVGFVRLTPGVDHFQNFEFVVRRWMIDPVGGRRIPVAAQTTCEYVRAILGENLALLVDRLFLGDRLEACQQVNAEAQRLDKTFAQIVIGAASEGPNATEVAGALRDQRFPVFACGGGGGFASVTLRALRKLRRPTAAGVPATDDGGSTGELQRWLRESRGFVFGVGDMAAILQDALDNRGKQALLAYRFEDEPGSLPHAVMDRVVAEVGGPTYPDSPLGAAPDFLSFTCDQLNLARTIDAAFRSVDESAKLPVKNSSVRNLNVLAAYELCGALGPGRVGPDARLAAFRVLRDSLGLPPDILALPVTYDECALFLDYDEPVPEALRQSFKIPEDALAHEGHRLVGQQYIDKLSQPGRRSLVGVVRNRSDDRRPRANPDYLACIRNAELFVMGAGSLVGSQLSQLAIPGVVDLLLEREDMRKILVLNHVRMDETWGMTLTDQVKLIERTCTEYASPDAIREYPSSDSATGSTLRIGDLFTDIVVPRTIARELEAEMAARGSNEPPFDSDELKYVDLENPDTGKSIRVFENRYVRFLRTHPEVREKYDISIREIEVLSYLDQPASLYARRSEGGRYRGALFATKDDLEYLVRQGIQERRIHEVDCVGENWKFVKAAGSPSLEFFPGLVPEALVGIFRIALERPSSIARPMAATAED